MSSKMFALREELGGFADKVRIGLVQLHVGSPIGQAVSNSPTHPMRAVEGEHLPMMKTNTSDETPTMRYLLKSQFTVASCRLSPRGRYWPNKQSDRGNFAYNER